jgi:hypothetical protein
LLGYAVCSLVAIPTEVCKARVGSYKQRKTQKIYSMDSDIFGVSYEEEALRILGYLQKNVKTWVAGREQLLFRNSVLNSLYDVNSFNYGRQ